MFRKKAKINGVNFWLAYCISLACRRHGVYINREEVQKLFSKENENKTFEDFNQFLSKKKLVADVVNININDLTSSEFILPCVVPLKNGGSIIILNIEKKENEVYLKILDPIESQGEQKLINLNEFQNIWDNKIIDINIVRGKSSKERKFDLSWFLPELWNCKYVLICAFVISIILNALAFTPIIFIQIALDKVVGYKAVSTLYVLTIGVIIALIFNSIIGYIREYIFNFVGDKIESRISSDIFDKLLSMPLLLVQGENIGRYGRSIQSISSLRITLINKIFHGIFDLTALLVYLPILFAYNIFMGIIVVLFSTIIGLTKIIFNQFGKNNSQELNDIEFEKTNLIRETLSGLNTLKELGEEEAQTKRWREIAAEAMRMKSIKNQINAASTEVSGFFQQAMTIAIIFTGIQLVFLEEMSAGSIIAINMVGGKLVAPVIAFITLISEKNQFLSVVQQVGDIWNADEERKGAGVHNPIKGKFILNSVSMNFGNVKALSNISLEIEPQSRIGIIGPSGAGKTTILNLFAGVFPPSGGSIDVDGIRITQYDLSYYRSKVILLNQTPVFFQGTIEDNLFRVAPNVGHRELEDIFYISGFDEHLNKLPDGIHSRIDENASQLSNAAMNLLALTRALLANPEVLLFDEFTDSLDINTRLKLKKNFNQITEGKTFINVCHEINSIFEYDKIFVFEHGEIVGQGSHENLSQNCETYRIMLEKEKLLYNFGETKNV